MTRRSFFSHLSPMGREIMLAMKGATFGKPMSSEAIADVIYAADPEGGPDWAARGIGVIIHKTRRRLNAIDAPIRICGRKGHGGGYWLEPVSNTDRIKHLSERAA